MIVEVNEVVQPVGMMDTIIQFVGTTPANDRVTFGVDHRPAKELFEGMKQAHEAGLPPVIAEIADWQILKVEVMS